MLVNAYACPAARSDQKRNKRDADQARDALAPALTDWLTGLGLLEHRDGPPGARTLDPLYGDGPVAKISRRPFFAMIRLLRT